MIEQDTFYVCDPERAVNCSKIGCKKMNLCNTTTDVDDALLVGGEPVADILFMLDNVNLFEEDPDLEELVSSTDKTLAVRR